MAADTLDYRHDSPPKKWAPAHQWLASQQDHFPHLQGYPPVVRQVWQQLLREGHRVARCAVKRRMRARPARRPTRQEVRTNASDPGTSGLPTRLQRDFTVTV
ncbi:hypothetical protein GCM10022419_124230 [Nonomuraea rosea]|uniref:HTH-like domain-containing protein n=1 Tax=Nonomuraea rosea TaxID=638574 RepID=A0ABP6ZRF7_9ACTN